MMPVTKTANCLEQDDRSRKHPWPALGLNKLGLDKVPVIPPSFSEQSGKKCEKAAADQERGSVKQLSTGAGPRLSYLAHQILQSFPPTAQRWASMSANVEGTARPTSSPHRASCACTMFV